VWLGGETKQSWSTSLWTKVEMPLEKMCRTWRSALKILTQEGGNLRQKLGKWKEIPEDKTQDWLQDGEWVYIKRGETSNFFILF
jgi:hypothetical protein